MPKKKVASLEIEPTTKPNAKVIIDSNIFISAIYSIDVEAYNRLLDIIKANKKNLIFCDQVIFEVRKHLKSPAPPKLFEERFTTKEAKEKADEARTIERKAFDQKVEKVIKFLTDELTAYGFTIWETTGDILKKARQRKLDGNPPGKKESLGDEIIWETILANANEDIVVVSNDGDFGDYKSTLRTEYEGKNGKELYIENDIYKTFKKYNLVDFEDLKVASETIADFIKEQKELRDQLAHAWQTPRLKAVLDGLNVIQNNPVLVQIKEQQKKWDDMFAPLREQQKQWETTLAPFFAQQKQLESALAPFREQQRQLEITLAPFLEQQRKMAEITAPFAKLAKEQAIQHEAIKKALSVLPYETKGEN